MLPNDMRNPLLRMSMATRHRTLAVLMLGLIGACVGATARAQEPGWVTDSFSGCRSWDPYGSYFTPENYIWVGACGGPDKDAAGPGVVVMTDSYGVAVVPQKVTGKDNSDFLAYNENGYVDGANHLVGVYDETTLHADSLYVGAAAIDEEVWTGLAPRKLIAAAEDSLARGWAFGAALLYIKVIEFHPNGPEARTAREGLARIKGSEPHLAALARRLHEMVNSGTTL